MQANKIESSLHVAGVFRYPLSTSYVLGELNAMRADNVAPVFYGPSVELALFQIECYCSHEE